MNAQLSLGLANAVFNVEMRYGAEEWVPVASFRYFDQAHLFVGAMQKRFGGFDYRVTEIEAAA